MPPKKKMISCPDCGKRYSARKEVCPDCGASNRASEDADSTISSTKEKSGMSVSGDPLAELGFLNGGMDDLAKWLKGEESSGSTWKKDISAGMEQKREVPVAGQDQKIEAIEEWLHGKVDDITTWLGEGGETRAVPREIEIPEEAREAYEQIATEEVEQIIADLQEGKRNIEEVSDSLIALLSEMESLRNKNQKLNDEIEMLRKGSTVLAKYFKFLQGKDEFEAERITDQLAKEMAMREQLEIENMELRTSNQTLKDKLEKGLKNIPVDEQELHKLQLQLSETENFLKEREDFLKEKEKKLAEQEASKGHELKERFTAELQERISTFEKSEKDLKTEMEKLEKRNKEVEIELRHKDQELKLFYGKVESGDLSELKNQLADYQRLERELELRNHELQTFRDKLSQKDDELSKLKEPMKYKEDEMLQREEDLMHREKLLQEELMRLEQAKAELGSTDELELKKRLEMLQADITAKEEEIQNKEKYIRAKEEELRLREQHVISEEIERRDEERSLEFKIEKVKTGISRLDDLLIGGLPFGSNILIYGPAFTGKEVLTNLFIAEGLKKGIPVIWVTTEKTPAELREEMQFIVSGFEEYEKLGLVKYIDSYSRSMGDDTVEENVFYIDAPTDFQSLQQGIEQAAKQLLTDHRYYRFIFRSISTMIAYLDPATAFKFLNPIVGRRKRDKAVSMFIIEKGMHGEQEIQMVGSLMDGMIDLKVENLNTFLSVKGIGEVQSRAWIRYTSTKSGLNIGSFALDHIR